MNQYLIPAEYQLEGDFELPGKPQRGHGGRWAGTTVAVAIIFGATLAVVCAAEAVAAIVAQ